MSQLNKHLILGLFPLYLCAYLMVPSVCMCRYGVLCVSMEDMPCMVQVDIRGGLPHGHLSYFHAVWKRVAYCILVCMTNYLFHENLFKGFLILTFHPYVDVLGLQINTSACFLHLCIEALPMEKSLWPIFFVYLIDVKIRLRFTFFSFSFMELT